MEKVFLTRVFDFSAGHRLFVEGMGEEENLKIFDKCANPQGHGHDYKVEFRVSSDISESTGMIMERPAIEDGVNEIKNDLDHRRIDQEVEYFRKNQSTVENIAVYIWNCLSGRFNGALKYVKVWENDRSCFEYYKEEIR